MNTKRFAVLVGAAGGFFGAIAYAGPADLQLLLSGPVESVDLDVGSITVLGHQLGVKNAASFLPGHVVNVFGGVQSNGSTSAALVQDTLAYASSGDQVSIVGVVRAVDESSGHVIVDGARVDYTALLGSGRFPTPAVGDLVRVLGIQPSGRGVVLASQITAIAGVSGGGHGLGVSGGGNALGVSGGGNALGVSGGGHGLGVSGGGNAMGVSGGGNALGVSGGGHGLGVSGGGNALGVSGGGAPSR